MSQEITNTAPIGVFDSGVGGLDGSAGDHASASK